MYLEHRQNESIVLTYQDPPRYHRFHGLSEYQSSHGDRAAVSQQGRSEISNSQVMTNRALIQKKEKHTF